MMRQLAWKECREGGQIWVALAFLGVLALCLAPVLHEPDLEARRAFLAVTLFVLSVAYGVTAGALMLAGEREGGTLKLLDHLVPRRRDVWERKLRIGAVFALAQGLFLAALLWSFDRWTEADANEETPFLPLACLEGFIWGLLGSALCPTALSAAGVAGLIGCIACMLSAAVGSVFGGPGAVVLRVGLDVGMLVGSASIFCRPDQKRALPEPETRRPPRLGAVGATVWLSWRQAWLEWLSLAGLALVAGQLLGANLPLAWPWCMLLVGILFGTRIWSEEQTEGSRRLLADRGLPLGTVWLVKTSMALLALLVVAGLLFSSAAFMCGVRHYVTGHQDWNPFENLILSDDPAVISYPALVVLSPAVGFAIGHLCGLLCRKRFLAIALAGALGVVLSFPWLPSLAAGLNLWPVLVGPALLLLTCRLILPAWCAERRLVFLAEASIVATVGWMAACLAWRALGVRDVGEPFDVQAYVGEMNVQLKSESAQEIRQALEEFFIRRTQVGPLRVGQRPEYPWEDGVFYQIRKEGWPTAPPEVGPWLNRLFDSPWPASLHKGVHLPLGVIEDPRKVGPHGQSHLSRAAGDAARLWSIRALQLQAQGQDETALRGLLDVFQLIRQLRHSGGRSHYGTGIEFAAADWLASWAGGSREPKHLRQALTAVEHHEATLSLFRDYVQGAYFSLHSWRSRVLDGDNWVGGWQRGVSVRMTPFKQGLTDLLRLGQELPWERERTERLVRYEFARALGFPANPTLDAQSETSILASFVRRTLLSSAQEREHVERRLRMLRLQLALVLFERENGRPAASLEELTPQVLPELPRDVPSGEPFVYRRATKSEDHVIVPGQYVIESRSGRSKMVGVPRLR